jgi:putative DNA primase/helicase
MQQVFAQMADALDAGEVWWLDASAEEQLDTINRQHMASSVVRDLVLSNIDHEVKDPSGSPAFTPTELLKYVEISNPSNAQVKECAQLLRELFGEPKRIRGSNKWRVPLLKVGSVHNADKRSEASAVPLPQGKSKFD